MNLCSRQYPTSWWNGKNSLERFKTFILACWHKPKDNATPKWTLHDIADANESALEIPECALEVSNTSVCNSDGQAVKAWDSKTSRVSPLRFEPSSQQEETVLLSVLSILTMQATMFPFWFTHHSTISTLFTKHYNLNTIMVHFHNIFFIWFIYTELVHQL